MINNVVLMGRLTAYPELKKTPSDISVISFTIAVDRKYQKQGDKQTDFINCVAWRNTADFISRYFAKGDMIAVMGEIQSRNYEDNKGNKRTAVEVIVSDVSFCGGKKEQNTTQQAAGAAPQSLNAADFEDDDDLPF